MPEHSLRDAVISDAQITFLPSTDLVQSRQFYEGVLGLELAVDQGTCHIYRVTPGAFVGTCLKVEPAVSDGVIFTFVTDDVDGWCQRIVSAGGTLRSGPEHNPDFGIYHAFLCDPDSNLLEIQRFDDPRWAS